MNSKIVHINQFRSTTEMIDLENKIEYYKELMENYERIINSDGNNMLAGMHNIFGKHTPEVKVKFLSFINQPNIKNWNNIRNYLIDSTTTAWQLWTRYDINAQRSGSASSYPEPDKFIEYFKDHKFTRINAIKEIIKETELALLAKKTIDN